MKLDPNRMIGGQPVRVVRDLLRDIRRYDAVAAQRFSDFLRKQDLWGQIDALYTSGKIDRDRRKGLRQRWEYLDRMPLMDAFTRSRRVQRRPPMPPPKL